MFDAVTDWLHDLAAHRERQQLVQQLERLSDHHLNDIGLRRDQLDLLRLPPLTRALRNSAAPPRDSAAPPVAAARPSLQGCG